MLDNNSVRHAGQTDVQSSRKHRRPASRAWGGRRGLEGHEHTCPCHCAGTQQVQISSTSEPRAPDHPRHGAPVLSRCRGLSTDTQTAVTFSCTRFHGPNHESKPQISNAESSPERGRKKQQSQESCLPSFWKASHVCSERAVWCWGSFVLFCFFPACGGVIKEIKDLQSSDEEEFIC